MLRAGTSPDAGVALTGDKSLMFLDASDAFVVFGISGGSWIAYGGPVGPAQAAEDVAEGRATPTNAARELLERLKG